MLTVLGTQLAEQAGAVCDGAERLFAHPRISTRPPRAEFRPETGRYAS
jgi:hypothetical protein